MAERLVLGVQARRRLLVRTTTGITIVATVIGAAIALHRVEQYVLAHERFRHPPVLQLLDTPKGIHDDIMTALEPVRDTAWGDARLCRRIGTIVEANPWVRRVRAVRKYGDGRVVIRCDHRRPAAMIQLDGRFYLASDDGVRLPGTYAYSPAMTLVEGVASPPPQPGEVWDTPDLRAAIAVAQRIEGEAFSDQITAVSVHNYGGRVDSEEPHIRLMTDQAGGAIIWGSAPGEELEENSAEEKIAILRENHRRFGRVDAGRHTIDVSIHPDRFTAPI